jgi:hypothetical protein
MKVGSEKKETNPVKPLDKIDEFDKNSIRVESNHFEKEEKRDIRSITLQVISRSLVSSFVLIIFVVQ